jgi:hypothetical protein
MARPESIAVGGFFPTPSHLIPLIARHLSVGDGGRIYYADPCAGDGAAIYGLHEAMGSSAEVFSCEMEAERHTGLLARANLDGYNAAQRTLHGDAFRIEMSAAIGCLLLNPPYDLDSVHGRLEQRFLERFTTALCDGGVVVFIVPHYALAASAKTLATTFDNVECFRFPKEDFAAFKQVVVFASKTKPRLSPDALILARVNGWAKTVARCPILGSKEDTHELHGTHSTLTWQLREFDLKGLISKARPWRESRSKGVAGVLTVVPHILPEIPVEDLLFRTYRVATAPRPAHIAAGIASGLFNGREVSSATPGMPNLLVKGVFTREYVTIQENVNSKGEITGVTQVQQPKLETTVLDLSTKRYSLLKPAGSATTSGIDGMGIEGLLEHYGPSLMNVMAEQCPVTYDPKRDATGLRLAPVGRPLFRAHEHAAKALLMLLGGQDLTPSERKGKAAILLGEIGSGKTATVLALGQTIAKCILVLCPPHLLDSWKNETRVVLPGADVRILSDLNDVDALARDLELPSDRTVIAVLSREDGKLGHGMAAVEYLGCCPKCGAPLPEGDLAKKRAHCDAKPLTLADDLARAAFTLALHVAPQAPEDGNVRALLAGRHLGRYLVSLEGQKKRAKWSGFDPHWVLTTIATVVQRLTSRFDKGHAELLGALLMADYDPEQIATLARKFSGSTSYEQQGLARALTCLLPFGGELQNEVQKETYASNGGFSHYKFASDAETLREKGLSTTIGTIALGGGQLRLNDAAHGSAKLALGILTQLAVLGSFPRAKEECGEALYQATPRPRRYPLAKYIARRHPNLFDLLLIDEAHENQNADSAQSNSAHRLTGLGIPFVLMTGSLMNGYAESLFTNIWAVSPDFRDEFRHDEKQRFNERYGYSKRILTDKDRETKKIVSFGTQSDRVERGAKTAGKAPGLLPLFLFRHLLAYAVTLHKADLALDLPKCAHFRHEIEPNATQTKNYKSLLRALKARISQDRYSTEGLAGKLFGALAELPSYLDRATGDTGNQDDGSYGIYYPKNDGGKLVAKAEPMSAKTILPKEQWMLDTVRAEIAEGRNVMVFCWHVNLLPRLARLLKEALGIEFPVLHADKVPPHKREAWINKNVRDVGARGMIANPVGIQTGLNNLVYFATEIWMEDPASNPTIFRQATGRVDRVGQKLETRIHTPVYAGTLQVQLHDLLLRKVAVSTATDGLDNESMLLAAGAAEDAMLTGLSIGRQLWDMMMDVN